MQWTIKRKLFLGFGFAAVMMVGGTGVAYWAQVRAQATQAELEATYGELNDLEHLVAYIHAVTSAQRAYMITGKEASVAAIPALRLDAKATAARVVAHIANDEEQKARFAQYQFCIQQRILFVNKLNTTRKDQGFEAAKALFDTGEDDRLLALIMVQFDAMRAAAKELLKTEDAANRRMQQQLGWTEFLGVLLALVLVVGVAVTLQRSISRNVQIAVEMVGAMAEKDLSGIEGVPATDDELAVAIHAINRMKQSMTTALGDVARSSEQVAAAGVEIDAAARQMAESTHSEQQSMETFASSLAEMNATVKEVAEHAERASMAASDAVSSASEGREMVRQTHQAMDRIHTSVNAASSDITTLGVQTQKIGDVVRIIQGIAEQTNLLALNAAIEAARAGDQGKGFAVVAQEVRQLAERTAKFTKEIADQIQAVQQGAGRAVQSMAQGETVVSEGVSQFNRVSASLEAIVDRIEAAQQGIAMIATATTQQSAATEGLTESIHLITGEVNQTAAQVDQAAAACTELAQLAAGLQSVVDSFQLPSQKGSGRKRAGAPEKDGTRRRF